nr:hypothetical protein KXZ65_19500 [Pectobacterium sp. PL152]
MKALIFSTMWRAAHFPTSAAVVKGMSLIGALLIFSGIKYVIAQIAPVARFVYALKLVYSVFLILK